MRVLPTRIRHPNKRVSTFTAAQSDIGAKPNPLSAPERDSETEAVANVRKAQAVDAGCYLARVVEAQYAERADDAS